MKKSIKKSLNVLLSFSLVFSVFMFGTREFEVYAEGLSGIVKTETLYYSVSTESSTRRTSFTLKLTMDNGETRYISSQSSSEPKQLIFPSNERPIDNPSVYNPETFPYIGEDGRVYKNKVNNTPISNLKFTEVVSDVYGSSFYGIGEDGLAWAWGSGSSGQLGTGVKSNRDTPLEILDPDTGDPILGVRKIVRGPKQGVVLLKDGKAYVLGSTLGVSSFDTAMPVEVPDFPEFDHVGEVELTQLSDASLIKETVSSTGKTYTLDGYTLWVKGIPYRADDTNTSLVSGSSLKYLLKPYDPAIKDSYVFPSLYGTSDGYGAVNKEDGLHVWGTQVQRWSGVPSHEYNLAQKVTATKADKVVYDPVGNTFYYKQGDRLFAVGENKNNLTSLTGVLKNTSRVLGPSDEFKSVKDMAVFVYMYSLLNELNTLVALTTDNRLVMSTRNGTQEIAHPNGAYFVGLIDIPKAQGPRSLYVIDSLGELYRIGHDSINPTTHTLTKIPGISGIAPKGYVPPTNVTAPTYTLSSNSLNQTVVTADYGSAPVKEYSLDKGLTWYDYVSPITVQQAGDSVVRLRAGDGAGNYSQVVDIDITGNTPITLPNGYPTITESGGVVTIDNNVPGTKIQVSVDGGSYFDYNASFPISNGSHTIEVVVVNTSNGQEISRRTETVTSSAGSTALDTPTMTVGNRVDENGQREVSISYNQSQGDLMLSEDGLVFTTNNVNSILVDNKTSTLYTKVVNAQNNESSVFQLNINQIKPTLLATSDGFYLDLSKFDITANNLMMFGYSTDPTPYSYVYTGQETGLSAGSYSIDLKWTNTNTSKELVLGTYNFTVGTSGGTPVPPEVSDPIGDTDVSLEVIGGGLAADFKGVDLSTIQIDSMRDYQTIVSSSKAVIEDSRATGEGWHYSLQITDFVSDPVMDASTANKDLVVKIPVNALSVDVKSSRKIYGQNSEVGGLGKSTFSTQASYLAKANPETGMGYYEIPLDFTLTVPNKVEVVTVGQGSNLVTGDHVGLRVGTYRSKFTFTLISGI